MKGFMTLAIFSVCLHLCSCIYMRMKYDHNKVIVNSSCNGEMFSLSVSSYGSQNSYFYMQSQVLSPSQEKHQIIHSVEEKKIRIQPPLKNEIILFNDYTLEQVNPDSGLGQFWLAIKHPLNKNEEGRTKNIHFIPLIVSEERRTQSFLMPAFSQPLSFLPSSSFYRCEKTLLSISEIDHYLDIAIFSYQRQNSWKLHGKWDWTWKKTQREINYGRNIKYDKQQLIKISIGNNKHCSFRIHELPSIPHNQQVWTSKSYKIDQILEKAIPLKTQDYDQL